MRSAVVLVAVLTVCLGNPRRPVPHHPNEELIDRALQRIADSRIINGKNAEITEYPWQASLRSNGSHSCGASIISPTWLVSAAHCTQNTDIGRYTVGVGHKELSEQDSSLKAVKQIINHEDYGKGAGNIPNDISLIELVQPLELDGISVKPIKLASKTIDEYSNKNCYISGWGVTSTGGGTISNVLQAVPTKVLSELKCEESWGRNINDGHVCIGGQNYEGACNGDSGGPLMCEDDGSFQLVGATSWGLNGCYTFRPSVYTEIAHFRDWITSYTDN